MYSNESVGALPSGPFSGLGELLPAPNIIVGRATTPEIRGASPIIAQVEASKSKSIFDRKYFVHTMIGLGVAFAIALLSARGQSSYNESEPPAENRVNPNAIAAVIPQLINDNWNTLDTLSTYYDVDRDYLMRHVIENDALFFDGEELKVGLATSLAIEMSDLDIPAELLPAQLPASRVHVVQPGENLSMIAQRYDKDLNEVISLNTQISNPSLIYPGQVIRLP